MNSKAAQPNSTRRLTEPVQEILRRRLSREPDFAGNLLGEAVDCLLRNEVVVAQLLLRDITNCTAGFPALARETVILEKSLMRMLSAKGMKRMLVATFILMVLFPVFIPQAGAQMDPLLCWNDGPTKQRILKFVEKVTKENEPDYVPPAECIAIFDADGTLWPERPLSIELYFVIHRLRQLAPKHPQWRKSPPFKVLFEKNPRALTTLSKQNIEKLMLEAYAGMTKEDFRHEVQKWIATWQHPQLKVGGKGLYYEPMHELLDYLRGNGFKTFVPGASWIRSLPTRRRRTTAGGSCRATAGAPLG